MLLEMEDLWELPPEAEMSSVWLLCILYTPVHVEFDVSQCRNVLSAHVSMGGGGGVGEEGRDGRGGEIISVHNWSSDHLDYNSQLRWYKRTGL